MPNDVQSGRDSSMTITKAILSARKARDEYKPFWVRYRKELTGTHYRRGQGMRRITNYCYLYHSAYLAQLAARVPRFSVKADQEYTDYLVAEIHRLAINKIAMTQNLLAELRLAITDSFYGPGIIKTGLYADTSYMGGPESADPGDLYGASNGFCPSMPFAERISPFNFLWDDRASRSASWAYAGHEFERDVDAVMNDPRYDQKALENVTPAEHLLDDGDKDHLRNIDGDIPPFFRMVELWVRPTNSLYTLVENSRREFKIVRKVPYFGRASGPYHKLGYTSVPDRSIELSPAAAWFDQYIELEINERKLNEQAQAEKRFVSFESQQHEAATLAQQVRDLGIVVGATGGQEYRWGGISTERQAYVAHERQHLERSSGVSDINLGVSDTSDTATGANLVNANKNLRIRDMKLSVKNFVEEIVSDWLFYVHNEPSVMMSVTMQSPEGLPTEVALLGGPELDAQSGQPTPDQAHHSEFTVTI